MKPLILSSVAIPVFCSVCLGSPGAISVVTLKMTESFTAPGTVSKDDAGRPVQPAVPAYENAWSSATQDTSELISKILTLKLSNKELLEFMVEQGIISSITGWSLKAAYGEDSDGPELYITKDGAAPIYVGNLFEFQGNSDVEAQKFVETFRYNSLGDETGYSIMDTSKVKSDVTVYFTSLDPEPLTMTINGIFNFTDAIKAFGSGDDREYRVVPGAGSITAISGTVLDPQSFADDAEGYYFGSVVEGSWAFAAATPLDDLSVLFPEADAP